MSDFRGSYTVAVTPFTEDGSAIDFQAWTGFLAWQLAVGVPGLIILGTASEYLAVSDDERTQLVERTVNHVNGRIPVLVGATNAYTPRAVGFAREAEQLGADGLMVAPPYYYTPTEDEIFRYYAAISEAVSIPIMIYNNPVTTNVDISARLVGRLTQAFENIRFIKEASLDVARVYDIVNETDGVMNVFAGERIVESFLLGAVGYVNVFGNFIPRASSRIWDYLVDGRLNDAKKIQSFITEMEHVISAGHPTYGHLCYWKALARAAGHGMGDVRPPLTRLDQLGAEEQDRMTRLTSILKQVESLVDTLDGTEALAV